MLSFKAIRFSDIFISSSPDGVWSSNLLPPGPLGDPPDHSALLRPALLHLLRPPIQEEHVHLPGHHSHQDSHDTCLYWGKATITVIPHIRKGMDVKTFVGIGIFRYNHLPQGSLTKPKISLCCNNTFFKGVPSKPGPIRHKPMAPTQMLRYLYFSTSLALPCIYFCSYLLQTRLFLSIQLYDYCLPLREVPGPWPV